MKAIPKPCESCLHMYYDIFKAERTDAHAECVNKADDVRWGKSDCPHYKARTKPLYTEEPDGEDEPYKAPRQLRVTLTFVAKLSGTDVDAYEIEEQMERVLGYCDDERYAFPAEQLQSAFSACLRDGVMRAIQETVRNDSQFGIIVKRYKTGQVVSTTSKWLRDAEEQFKKVYVYVELENTSVNIEERA